MGRRGETAAIFARVPRLYAERLDRLSFELKRPKQEILAGLIAQHLPPEPPAAESERDEWTVGRYAFRPRETPEILTLEEAAAFLQVDEDVLRSLAATGEIPGREIGGQWRFARHAILEWLSSPEPPPR